MTRARTLLARLLSLVLLLVAMAPDGQRLAAGTGSALVGLSAPDAVLAATERAAPPRIAGDARGDGPLDGIPPAAFAETSARRGPALRPDGPSHGEARFRAGALARGPPDRAA